MLSEIPQIVILSETVRYRCGHYDEIRGLSRRELDYLSNLAWHFSCIACQVKTMFERRRVPAGPEEGQP